MLEAGSVQFLLCFSVLTNAILFPKCFPPSNCYPRRDCYEFYSMGTDELTKAVDRELEMLGFPIEPPPEISIEDIELQTEWLAELTDPPLVFTSEMVETANDLAQIGEGVATNIGNLRKML